MEVKTRWLRPDSSRRHCAASSSSSALGRMRRPTATTVSAARTKAPRSSSARLMASSATFALVRDRRVASARGTSPFLGTSSTSAGCSESGSIPAWLMRESRRGEPDASTSLGRPIMISLRGWLEWEWPRCERLLEPVGDAPFGQVIGRHLHQNLVAGKHADAVLAHAAGRVGDDLVLVLELDAEGGVRKQF